MIQRRDGSGGCLGQFEDLIREGSSAGCTAGCSPVSRNSEGYSSDWHNPGDYSSEVHKVEVHIETQGLDMTLLSLDLDQKHDPAGLALGHGPERETEFGWAEDPAIEAVTCLTCEYQTLWAFWFQSWLKLRRIIEQANKLSVTAHPTSDFLPKVTDKE